METSTRRPDRDTLLQASRRVDWRFLLPDPELGRVACSGPHDAALLESLELFSTSLTVLETLRDGSGDGDPAFDVVVLRDPSLVALRAASVAVRPGGWLYVEIHRPLGRALGAGRPRLAHDCVAELERLGLEEVAAHWHWPSFGSCAEMVPLAEPSAIRYALSRRRSSPAARVKARLGRLLLGAGLFGYLASDASVVARRPAGPGGTS